MLSVLLLAATLICVSLPSALAASFTVTMSSFTFTPSNRVIAVGDQVTWTNISTGLGSTHTSTRGDPLCSTNGFVGTFWHSGNVVSHATYTFTFTNFAAGTYTYLCVPHCSVQGMRGAITITNPPNTPPTVSITNPIANAAFPAPADIALGADASDVGGSVTNVQFFFNGTLVASLVASPYNFTLNNVAAGNYSFTAIAKNNFGTASTSSVVPVFVLTNAILSQPSRFPNGQFRLTISGIAGQTYATDASSNLLDWKAIATNVAPANIFNVTDSTSTNILQRFYRARQNF